MNIAIVLSGGIGSRMGLDVPKQYVEVAGMPIICYSLKTLDASNRIDAIWIVAADEWLPQIKEGVDKYGISGKICGYSKPGENRQLSIYNALMDINKSASAGDYVFIHDAARPMLTVAMIEESIDGMKGYDGVIPVLTMKDTVYLSRDGKQIDSLLNRGEIYAGQAPETFVFGKYLEANRALFDSGAIKKINGSTEPAIISGMKMHMISGDERNIKITTKADLVRFQEMIKE